MARAQWSPRVWEPMTKEGLSLPSAKELLRGSLVWHCPALAAPWGDVGWRGGTLWDPLALRWSPGHPSKVVVSLQPILGFCWKWGKTAWHPAGVHRVQGKGDKTGKCRGTDLSFCLDGPRAGQAAHRVLLWGEVSRALDYGMIGVAHLGFKRCISLYSSEPYPEILIINKITIKKSPKHLPRKTPFVLPRGIENYFGGLYCFLIEIHLINSVWSPKFHVSVF